MKRIKKTFIAALALSATLSLTGCSKTDGLGLKLESGDEEFMTSDILTVTNQEVFQAMAMGVDGNGLNNGVTALLDLVDYDLLSDKFEVNQERIQEDIEYYKGIYEDFESFLTSNGFENEEALVKYMELMSLREEAARATLEISEEEIQAYYDEVYVAVEEDTATEEETDAEEEALEEETETDDEEVAADEEVEESTVPTLEEVRETIEESLISSQLTGTLIETEVARLRQEAGFTILDAYLQDQYMNFLEMYGVVVEDVFTKQSKTSTSVVAELGETQYTAEDLYNGLLPIAGLTSAIGLVDPAMLAVNYEVSDEEINEIINNLKIQFEDQFYPMMLQYYGLNGDQEIFDYIKLVQLQDAAFVANYEPTEARLQELYEEFLPERSARHILVTDEELAKEIIAQLETAEDLDATFAELAQEHGTDATATEGGDLGTFDSTANFVQEFKDAVFQIPAGEFTTEPVETEFGYHVIYVYNEGTKGTFEELRDTLKQQELDNLYSSTRLEAILLREREAINIKFTNPTMQTRYQTIATNINDALES